MFTVCLIPLGVNDKLSEKSVMIYGKYYDKLSTEEGTLSSGRGYFTSILMDKR
jgi:hypothetical protein